MTSVIVGGLHVQQRRLARIVEAQKQDLRALVVEAEVRQDVENPVKEPHDHSGASTMSSIPRAATKTFQKTTTQNRKSHSLFSSFALFFFLLRSDGRRWGHKTVDQWLSGGEATST